MFEIPKFDVPKFGCVRPQSALSDRSLWSLDRNDLLIPRSRTSTSQQCACAFASAGNQLSNCIPAKNPCSYSLWFIYLYSLPL